MIRESISTTSRIPALSCWNSQPGLSDYESDRGFRSAVQRELQVIGEALTQLHRLAPETASRISEHRRIINFRNILVHGYDVLKADIVWHIVECKLAVLKREVDELLAANP